MMIASSKRRPIRYLAELSSPHTFVGRVPQGKRGPQFPLWAAAIRRRTRVPPPETACPVLRQLALINIPHVPARRHTRCVVCIAAGVPSLLWGSPGEGKTSAVVQVAEAHVLHAEVVIAALREPADFASLQVPDAGSCHPSAYRHRRPARAGLHRTATDIPFDLA